MGQQTTIEWCDHTFNPWMGCTKVSPLCDNCYAETLADTRRKWVEWGPHAERRRTALSTWKQPLTWNRKAERAGTRPFVFTASLADVFDNQADPAWRADLFALIRVTPALVYLLLTKRPQNILRMSAAAGGLPANVALGASAGIQSEMERNGAHLTAAKVKLKPEFVFLSVEPLLEAVDMMRLSSLSELDWVIVGGESGWRSRPMDPQWARDVRDQCAAAQVTFFFKQQGARPGPGAKTLDGITYAARPALREAA